MQVCQKLDLNKKWPNIWNTLQIRDPFAKFADISGCKNFWHQSNPQCWMKMNENMKITYNLPSLCVLFNPTLYKYNSTVMPVWWNKNNNKTTHCKEGLKGGGEEVKKTLFHSRYLCSQKLLRRFHFRLVVYLNWSSFLNVNLPLHNKSTINNQG